MTEDRILICDDDDDVRAVAAMSLETVGGFHVVDVPNGAEALEEFARVRPDLVVLDVRMPSLDGPATLAALRRLPGGAAVPVIFLSARPQPAEAARLASLGVLAVLEKPFDPLAFPQSVRTLLDEHRATTGPSGACA